MARKDKVNWVKDWGDNYHCIECGSAVVLTDSLDLRNDYCSYCSNPYCKYHNPTYHPDQQIPYWIFDEELHG